MERTLYNYKSSALCGERGGKLRILVVTAWDKLQDQRSRCAQPKK